MRKLDKLKRCPTLTDTVNLQQMVENFQGFGSLVELQGALQLHPQQEVIQILTQILLAFNNGSLELLKPHHYCLNIFPVAGTAQFEGKL